MTEPETEAEPGTEPEPEPEPDTEPDTELDTEPETELSTEPETESTTEPETELQTWWTLFYACEYPRRWTALLCHCLNIWNLTEALCAHIRCEATNKTS